MKTPVRIIRLILFVSLGTLVMVSEAQAKKSCHKINARGVGQDLGVGISLQP